MLPLIESIAVKDGELLNLKWHEERYQKSILALYGHQAVNPLLEGCEINIPAKGYYKLRIAYSDAKKEWTLSPYSAAIINTLKVVEDNNINYHLKYSDRKHLNQLFDLRGVCDDILIIKNGCISDTFAGNILFYDGKEWLTPDTPLLKGTCRSRLLFDNIIKAQRIKPQDLYHFSHFQIINALRPFQPEHKIPIRNIEAL